MSFFAALTKPELTACRETFEHRAEWVCTRCAPLCVLSRAVVRDCSQCVDLRSLCPADCAWKGKGCSADTFLDNFVSSLWCSCGGEALLSAVSRGTCATFVRDRACVITRIALLHFERAVHNALPFAYCPGLRDAAFDVVVSQDSFLHAGADRDKCLLEASRILKPGGIMVFSDIMIKEDAAKVNVEKASWKG